MQTDRNIIQYKKLDGIIDSIYENINHLSSIHKKLLDDTTNKINCSEYIIYIDDIYFQRNVLTREVEHLLLLKQMSIRRYYACLFRLYQDVTHTYIEVVKDRQIGFFGSPEHMRIFYNEPHIRMYNDLDIITLYRYQDIETIIVYILHYIRTIQGRLTSMDVEIRELEGKMTKGYHLHSVLNAYRNERVKHANNIDTFMHIFNSIQTMNYDMIRHFIERSVSIRDEIKENISNADIRSNMPGYSLKSSDLPAMVIIPTTANTNVTIDTSGNYSTPICDSDIRAPVHSKDETLSLHSKDGESSIEKAMTDLIHQNISSMTHEARPIFETMNSALNDGGHKNTNTNMPM